MQLVAHKEFPLDLKNDWDALLAESIADVPFLRFDCLHSWWQTRGGGEWPAADLLLLTAYEEGRLVGIAPFFSTGQAPTRTLMLLGSIEVFDYLDFIVRRQHLPGFISALLDWLGSLSVSDWQVLDLYNLIDSSPTLPLLEAAAAARGWHCSLQQIQPSPYIPLPGDWEAYLAGIKKKQRHEIRRKMRRLEEGDVSTRWYVVEDASQLEAEMDAFLDLMAQDPAKVSFLTGQMRDHMQRIARCAFQAGFLQLSFLEIDGGKAAGKMAFNYRRRLLAYNSGVDQQYLDYSPGWVLLGYLLQWANENGMEEFDFMRGDEEYKYRFGAIDRFVMRATLQR